MGQKNYRMNGEEQIRALVPVLQQVLNPHVQSLKNMVSKIFD